MLPMIKTVFTGILLLWIYFSYADPLSAPIDTLTDTAKKDFVSTMERFAKASSLKSSNDLEADRRALRQNHVFEAVKKATQEAKNYLRKGIDTADIQKELERVQAWHQLAGDGIFSNKGSTQTYRNLTTSNNLLAVLANTIAARKSRVDLYQQKLSTFRYQIDSLTNDPSLFKFPTDSVALTKYLQKLAVAAYEVAPIDSALKRAIDDVQTLQNQINMEAFRLASSQEDIAVYQQEVSDQLLEREFANIWDPNYFDRPFREIIHFSSVKDLLVLRFYMKSHLGKILILLSLVGVCMLYLRALKKKYTQDTLQQDFGGQLILRSPLLSAIIIIFSIFQFLFPAPPFIFNFVLWVIPTLLLTFVFHHFISSYWFRFWLLIVLLFITAGLNNLLLQASRPERWIMLTLAGIGLLAGGTVLWKGRHQELREKWILYPIGLMMVLALLSVFCNVFGRYNLAKTLLIASYMNVVIAILFLWTVRLVNEGLSLASNAYTHQERKLFFLNYNRVGRKAPSFFYAFLILGWLILFGRNFYAFRQISEPLQNFLTEERSLGAYTFSINKLLTFIVIMLISTIISRIVSFFVSDQQWTDRKGVTEKKLNLGSWLLLIRISIIVLGLMLAFAAAGIPMDRITLIVGALGVGIGFGLQTLVNNLVSGLIIAFEKPVNVGDLIELGGQGGTVKSIGFRSSVISTTDGADLVLPNGDLLNSHVINWTLGGMKKRLNIMVGIAYGSDLEYVRSLLIEKINEDDRILKFPAPVIQFQQFNNSSIDLNIFFWVKHIGDGGATKSDMIITIDKLFRAKGISIPFPQQDIHLHKPDSTERAEET